MKTRLEKIRKTIAGAPRYSVSAELDRKVQGALGWQKISPTIELEAEDPIFSFNWIAPWLSRSFRQFSVAVVAIVLMVGGVWFYTQNSYVYHLGKAKASLADLESVLAGKPIASNLWMGQAFAEDSAPAVLVNEAQVVNLTHGVVRETEKAIRIVERKSDPIAIGKALAEVATVQDRSVPVFAAAVEAVTTAEATQTVAAAIETTATDQGVVAQAQDFVAKAVTKGERHVAIEMQTAQPVIATEEEDDGRRLADAKVAYGEAKAEIEKLKASESDPEILSGLQSKLSKVVAAFEEGKIGRAKGLSVAISAQGKHLIRKGAKRLEGAGKGAVKGVDGESIRLKQRKAEVEIRSSESESGFGKEGVEDARFEKPEGLKRGSIPGKSVDDGDSSRQSLPQVDGSHPRIPRLDTGKDGRSEKPLEN